MTSTELLEWVMGWPWPVIVVFVLLIAGGIGRLVYWDKEDRSAQQSSSGQSLNKECICRCE
ncbi:MAG TPA: hypothetical protein DCP92_08210 [Nitrospiraceae bacterium]|nr:hypothetical protein [Nitrospiraceae bacterium]